MPFNDAAVKIDGIRDLRRGLGKLDKQFPKDLNREIKQVGERIADDARAHVPVLTGRAKASIRATTSGSRAYIVGGKKSVPYYAWLDFGGGIPNQASRRRRGLQRPWRSRPIITGGRFIYPAVERARPRLEQELPAIFDRAKAQAFRSSPR